ncbi:MAG: aspartate kinase [Chloroflexi bacterium]|nr:aspartate kinase [Chloroflexota bacterium]
MFTVSDAVREIVQSTPFLGEGLAEGILNLSAVARKIQPRVQEKLQNEVKRGAIVMALKRFSSQVGIPANGSFRLKNLGDFTVRSHLVELTFSNSESLIESHKNLLRAIERRRGVFLNLSQGVFETTIVCNSSIEDLAEAAFQGEKLIIRFTDVSSITLQLTKEIVNTPGVYFAILRALALEGINVVEVISTYMELTLVLYQKDIDRAFSLLKQLII